MVVAKPAKVSSTQKIKNCSSTEPAPGCRCHRVSGVTGLQGGSSYLWPLLEVQDALTLLYSGLRWSGVICQVEGALYSSFNALPPWLSKKSICLLHKLSLSFTKGLSAVRTAWVETCHWQHRSDDWTAILWKDPLAAASTFAYASAESANLVVTGCFQRWTVL